MLDKIEHEVLHLPEINELQLPTQDYFVKSNVGMWSGCDSYKTEIAEKFGKQDSKSEYEIEIEFTVNCDDKLMNNSGILKRNSKTSLINR